MATLKPFKSVRPQGDYANKIAALPYDVYNTEEAREIVKENPLSFLKIDRAETNFDKGVDTYSEKVYEKASELLYKMIKDGEFVQEEKPCLYLYKLTMNGRSQTGLVGCTSIDEYESNQIKKHELTRDQKEKDRINHVDYCNANTGPIFLTYRQEKTVDIIVDQWIESTKAEYDFVANDGIRHEVFVIDDAKTIKVLQDEFDNINALYIADGHHRTASAAKVGLKRREENPDYDGSESFNYFLSVIFPDKQLKIMDYNRVVKDLNGLTSEQLLEAISKAFDILNSSNTPIRPMNKTEFSMYLDDRWYLIKSKPNTYEKDDPVLSLDVSILQLNLLSSILGIGDPRTDDRIDFVGGIRGLEELERRVHSDMKVAFALVPTSIEELMSIADANELMPPKSTWFEPKLRSGIFIHLLK